MQIQKFSLYTQFCCVYKVQKKNKPNTDVWQIVWGMAPTSKEKNPCQNVNIVLLVGKHATHTHWDLEQVSGLFFFFFASQQHGHV